MDPVLHTVAIEQKYLAYRELFVCALKPLRKVHRSMRTEKRALLEKLGSNKYRPTSKLSTKFLTSSLSPVKRLG